MPVRSDVGFAGFVREHTPALLRTAYLLTGSAAAAEELVQDTLVRLYPKWQRVEVGRSAARRTSACRGRRR